MAAPPPPPIRLSSATVVELENAVGSQLAMAELGIAPPLQIANRYRVRRLLGRGARGVVCEARDLHLHRDVAIKLFVALIPGRAAQEVALEAQALARLRHANVVGVYDFGDTTLALQHEPPLHVPLFFITMEHIRGQSLRSWLSTRAPPFEQVLAAFHQAGAGLAHAHASGVVHRDFKPDNVVIADDGRVLVVDFGFAHRSATQPEATSTALMLWSGGMVGTPAYMAPEARNGMADARSDQYSFALSLYEALAGSLPIVSNQGLQLDFSRIPEPIGRAVFRALASDPRQRYASMSELLDELLLHLTEPSKRVSPREPALALEPRPWLAGLGVGLVFVGLVGLATWWLNREPDHAGSNWLASTASAFGVIDSACPEAALVGRWEFETHIWWDYTLRSIGSRDYRMQLRRGQGCELIATLDKLDDDTPSGEVTLDLRSRNTDGSVELRGAWNLAQDYTYTFTFRGDQLEGDYVSYHRTGRPAIKGPLSGARVGHEPSIVGRRRDLPCRSQCRLLCAGSEATNECELEQCIDPSAFVADCGAPSADFHAPMRCTDILTELDKGKWQAARDGSACERVVPVLVGRWSMHERRNSGEVVSWKIELHSNDCRLVGTARSEGEQHKVLVELDDEGQWLLSTPETPGRLFWVMYGWEFAVGLGAGDRPARIRGQRDWP